MRANSGPSRLAPPALAWRSRVAPYHDRATPGDGVARGLTTFRASLVSRIPPPTKGGFLELAAGLVAVALAPVVRPTDDESLAAPAATQLEDNELVHPARKDENWTATSANFTVPTYWLSIRRLYTRVQAPTWALIRFPPIGRTRPRRGARLPGARPP